MTRTERNWMCPFCGKPQSMVKDGVLEHMKEAHAPLFKVFPNPLAPPQSLVDVVVD